MDVDSILHHAFKLRNILCFIEEKLVKYLVILSFGGLGPYWTLLVVRQIPVFSY